MSICFARPGSKNPAMKKTTRTALLALAAFAGAAFAQQPASITPAPRTEQEEKWVSNHEARVAAAKKGDIDVILIGDSITHYSERSQAFKHHFGARKALNLGQGGDRTRGNFHRRRQTHQPMIKPTRIAIPAESKNTKNTEVE